jgi:hypothetical protein
MTWERVHKRHELVHAVLDDLSSAGRSTVPARFAAEIEAEFGDFGGFLREVQLRWYRAFDARLDALLENEPDDLRGALIDLWRELVDAMPAARRLLGAYATHPALVPLDRHHRRSVHAVTGISHDLLAV